MRRAEYGRALQTIEQTMRIISVVTTKGSGVSMKSATTDEILAAMLTGIAACLAVLRELLVEIHEPVPLDEPMPDEEKIGGTD